VDRCWPYLLTAPVTNAVAHQWPSAAIRQEIENAAVLVPEGRPERRIVGLANPGVAGLGVATTGTLFAAVQIIQPGEQVPAARNSMSSIRFGIEGDGVVTLVNGTPVPMRPRDLLVQRADEWHKHRNGGPPAVCGSTGSISDGVSTSSAVVRTAGRSVRDHSGTSSSSVVPVGREMQAALGATAAVDGVRRLAYGADGRVSGTLGCERTAIDAVWSTRKWRVRRPPAS
jgi:hypothetical protein